MVWKEIRDSAIFLLICLYALNWMVTIARGKGAYEAFTASYCHEIKVGYVGIATNRITGTRTRHAPGVSCPGFDLFVKMHLQPTTPVNHYTNSVRVLAKNAHEPTVMRFGIQTQVNDGDVLAVLDKYKQDYVVDHVFPAFKATVHNVAAEFETKDLAEHRELFTDRVRIRANATFNGQDNEPNNEHNAATVQILKVWVEGEIAMPDWLVLTRKTEREIEAQETKKRYAKEKGATDLAEANAKAAVDLIRATAENELEKNKAAVKRKIRKDDADSENAVLTNRASTKVKIAQEKLTTLGDSMARTLLEHEEALAKWKAFESAQVVAPAYGVFDNGKFAQCAARS